MEDRQVDPQPPHPALALLYSRPGLFARQGSVVATMRRRKAGCMGPYYRLEYREARRKRSIYLGREGPLIDQIRQALDAVQAPWKRQRAQQQLRREGLALLRGSKSILDRKLRALGLRLQGFEVRGWRTSPLLRSLRRRRA